MWYDGAVIFVSLILIFTDKLLSLIIISKISRVFASVWEWRTDVIVARFWCWCWCAVQWRCQLCEKEKKNCKLCQCSKTADTWDLIMWNNHRVWIESENADDKICWKGNCLLKCYSAFSLMLVSFVLLFFYYRIFFLFHLLLFTKKKLNTQFKASFFSHS